MSVDPAIPLQKSVYAALVASGVASGKVFHTVPAQTALPYCVIGDDIIEAEYDSGKHSRCTVVVDVFAATLPQAKQLAAIVRTALDVDLTIEDFNISEAYFVSTRYVKEPNGMTSHAVLMFEYLLIPA